MKKIFTLCLGIAIAVSSYATHLMGGQISANYISTNASGSHYYLELDVYRDTLGVSMTLNQSVDVFVLDSSGNYNLAFTQSLTFGVGGAVSSMSFTLPNRFDVDRYFQICLDVESLGSNLNLGFVLCDK